MTEIGLGYKRSKEEPDNLKTAARRAGNPHDETPYDGKDKRRGRVARIPMVVLRGIGRIFRRHGTKCGNKNERKVYGRRFKTCPIPTYRRFADERYMPPYWCVYCALKKDPEPPE